MTRRQDLSRPARCQCAGGCGRRHCTCSRPCAHTCGRKFTRQHGREKLCPACRPNRDKARSAARAAARAARRDQDVPGVPETLAKQLAETWRAAGIPEVMIAVMTGEELPGMLARELGPGRTARLLEGGT